MRWKGKKVSRKRFLDLKANAEFRRIFNQGKYGHDSWYGKFIIGGNKNSLVNKISVY